MRQAASRAFEPIRQRERGRIVGPGDPMRWLSHRSLEHIRNRIASEICGVVYQFHPGLGAPDWHPT
jgi:hypothetical protein